MPIPRLVSQYLPRDYPAEVVALVDGADIGDEAGVDVLLDRGAGVGLPHVRWVAGQEAVGENDLSVAAAPTRDRGVTDGYARVGGAKVVEQHVEGGALGPGRPPREHLQIAGRVRAGLIGPASTPGEQ